MLPYPALWLLLRPPRLAMVPPPNESLGRRMTLSPGLRIGDGGTALGRTTDICGSFAGSWKVTQSAKFC